VTTSSVIKDPDRKHEPSGLRPAFLWLSPIGLALLIGGALAACWLTVVTVSARDLTVETVRPTFPAPGAEPNQALERQRLFQAQRETLDSYAWADREAGVAQVPIGRAMELMTAKHLAGLGKAGAEGEGARTEPGDARTGASLRSSADADSLRSRPGHPKPVAAPKPRDGGEER
jgi:hypothetical protein